MTQKVPKSNKENKIPELYTFKYRTEIKAQTIHNNWRLKHPNPWRNWWHCRAESESGSPKKKMVTKMVYVCLQWYCRSPLSYKSFRATTMLILPCPSTLIQSKNTGKPRVGLDNQILHWMHSEAVWKEIRWHSNRWDGNTIRPINI